MKRIARGALLLALCLVLVAGMVLTGCGKKKEAALQQPDLEFTGYVKGATVDFDEATLNNMAAGAQASFMYGIAKTIYPSVWAANKDTVAQAVFPAPYFRGDGIHTYYSYLTSADQGTVDGTIFATKLSAAEQGIVTNSVESFFALYADEIAAAKPLQQNTVYMVLYFKVSADAANAWVTDATAWMAALNAYAAANYGGKTYAQLTYIDRKTVEGTVFAKGYGIINPEYSAWRIMTKDRFRNGVASTMNPSVRDGIASTQYGLAYASLDCVQKPTVDAMVWATIDAVAQATVNGAVATMLTSQATLDGALSAVSATAVAGFDAEVAAGTKMELAFYKWLAYESFRNGTASTFYPTQVAANLPAGKTYTTLSLCEQLAVDAAVWAALGTGEHSYAASAVSGLWGKAQAEMADAFATDQTTAAMALRATMYTAGRIADGKAFYSETAATNFKTDVESGMLIRSAFYKWLAKESVKESAAAAILIRESLGEFYLKITNPNEYPIWIDIMRLYFRTTAGASSQVIDGARQVLEGIWVPAKEDDQDGEVTLKVLAPTKTYDLLSWMAMAGVNTNTARAMATEVFDKIQAGTVVWTVEADVQVSHEEDIQTFTYTLTET